MSQTISNSQELLELCKNAILNQKPEVDFVEQDSFNFKAHVSYIQSRKDTVEIAFIAEVTGSWLTLPVDYDEYQTIIKDYQINKILFDDWEQDVEATPLDNKVLTNAIKNKINNDFEYDCIEYGLIIEDTYLRWLAEEETRNYLISQANEGVL